MTHIVTSNWFADLNPEVYARIGISRMVPRGQREGTYQRYPALNPGEWFKSCASWREYKDRYFAEVLAPLDPQKVVDDLVKLADGKVPALLCFEGSEPRHSPCHRGLVSAWLKDTLGLDVFEYGHGIYGCGWAHPKIDASLRQGPTIEEIERAHGFVVTPKAPKKPSKKTNKARSAQGKLL